MKSLDEDTALSIVFSNTKRKKRAVDLITVAESCDYLAQLYGSQKAVAEKVGLSSEMIREFRKLLTLPAEVRDLISSRQIDRLDVAYRISMLEEPTKQIDAARAIADLPSSKDVRDILRLAESGHLPLEESKRIILESKPKGLHIFVVDFDDRTYDALIAQAKAREVEAADLVKGILRDWRASKASSLKIVAPPAILETLRGYGQYLQGFPQSQRSAIFEHLVAQAVSCILHLPFYTRDDEDHGVAHRVTWRGSIRAQVYSRPSWGADAIAYAYGYSMLIEPTLKQGATQWGQEFEPCCRHYDQFVRESGCNPSDAYLLMIAESFHDRTWLSVAHQREINFVLMELPICVELLDTAMLALTMTHLQFRMLLHDLVTCCRYSDSLDEFRAAARVSVDKWKVNVLRDEKSAFLGMKAYEALKQTSGGFLGISEIFGKLYRHPMVAHYMRALGVKLSSQDIEGSLIRERLGGTLTSVPYGNEPLFCPVPLPDYVNRAKRIIQEVEEIDEQSP